MKAKRANEILAANLRRLMKEHPTLNTQVKLARRAGIAQSSITRVLSASVHPQLDIVEALAGAFRVPLASLLSDQEDATDPGFDQAKFAQLPAEEREKAASYIRFLIAEHEQPEAESAAGEGLIRLLDLHDLSEVQLAQVMRAAIRELNNNTLAEHESAQTQTIPRKKRASTRH